MIEDIQNGNFHDSIWTWAYHKCIVGLNYRGGDLDGPNLGKLFANLDSLQEFVHPKFHGYIDAMRKFDQVKKACFGQVLHPDWIQKILDFETSYKSLGISITIKVHVVLYEVPIFILRHNKPLGLLTEQKFETAHTKFPPVWSRFKREENHVEFPEKLKAAAVHFNGERVC